jgi:hypothetical protein
MTLLLIISIAIIAVIVFAAIRSQTKDSSQSSKPLLDLKSTTLAERQQYYKRSYRLQMQYDELQRRAEASGDTATLEAIRLNTYTGPLPELEDKKPTPKIVLSSGDSDASIQELQYFCIKDKGYHTSVWPRGHHNTDVEQFSIAGLSHSERITDYLGEFKGTLAADPDNPYDHNAIEVLAPDGHHVGFVPKNMTSIIRKYSTLPCPCYCYIGMNGSTLFSDCYIII